MKRLAGGIAIFFLAMTWPGLASGAEAPIFTPSTIPVQLTGVITESKPGGVAIVTFGIWNTPQLRDHTASRTAGIDQTPKEQPNRLSQSRVRRAIYLPYVRAAERQFALPEGLLDALIWTESRYNPLARSKAGAAGLGQLMPETARAVGVSNRYDPRTNLAGTAQYLRQMLDQFGKIRLAVAAYNAGPNAVQASGGIPQNTETPSYVRKVLVAWQSY